LGCPGGNAIPSASRAQPQTAIASNQELIYFSSEQGTVFKTLDQDIGPEQSDENAQRTHWDVSISRGLAT